MGYHVFVISNIHGDHKGSSIYLYYVCTTLHEYLSKYLHTTQLMHYDLATINTCLVWFVSHKLDQILTNKIWNNSWHQKLTKQELIGIGKTSALFGVHGMFLERWNSTKSPSSICQHFSCRLDEGIQKYERKWIRTVAFWGQTKVGQKCAARWAELAVLFCR